VIFFLHCFFEFLLVLKVQNYIRFLFRQILNNDDFFHRFGKLERRFRKIKRRSRKLKRRFDFTIFCRFVL